MVQLAKNATLKWGGESQLNRRNKDKKRSASRGRARRADPTQGLQVANPNAAGIDIGASEHWVSVPADRDQKPTQRFGCCTAELHRLADWLKHCRIDTVVMEATGNYWVVLYDLLEECQLNPVVVNPRYAKNMSGKKGDIPDCQWMQKLHTYGLFANSFRPAQEIRVLRAYLRQREQLVAAASQQIQHLQHSLTEMNVQLTNVISDISGETGLAIIDAMLRGERDPHALAELEGAPHPSQPGHPGAGVGRPLERRRTLSVGAGPAELRTFPGTNPPVPGPNRAADAGPPRTRGRG